MRLKIYSMCVIAFNYSISCNSFSGLRLNIVQKFSTEKPKVLANVDFQ